MKRLNNIQTFIREFIVPNLETEVEYKIVLFVCLFGILCLSISIECSFQYPQNYFIINSETIRIVFVWPYINQGQGHIKSIWQIKVEEGGVFLLT